MLSLLKRRPNASDVAERLVILRYQVVHALAAPPKQLIAHFGQEERAALTQQFRALSDQTCASLKARKLWGKLSAVEKDFFSTPGVDLEPQAHLNAVWRAEAAGCLMWSLYLLEQLPPYDKQVDPELLRPIAAEGVQQFLAEAKLRPEGELRRARDIAELWHWRSRTRELQDAGVPIPAGSGVHSFDEIIGIAATHAEAAGDIPSAIDNDLPVFGRAYRSASPEEWSAVRSITMERHFALNWLCGRSPGNRWESTPTDT